MPAATTAVRARTTAAAAEPAAVAVRLDGGDPALVPHDRAVPGRRPLQHGHHGVGVHPAGGGRLEQR